MKRILFALIHCSIAAALLFGGFTLTVETHQQAGTAGTTEHGETW
ncbi:hypothetical protein [Fictibacillus gelatini]|nr:hypothetical protein [Fictibacillus gelatini]